jgi:hypothetical protein
MSGDLVQVGVGLFFVSWRWWFPRWLHGMRSRMTDPARLDRFDARFTRVFGAIGTYAVPVLGLVLVISGLVFLLGDI